MLKKLILLIFFGLLATAACTPVRMPSGDPDAEGRALIQSLQERQKSIRKFAGRGGIKIIQPDSQHYFDIMAAAVQPEKLRLQAFDFLGRPILTITVDKNLMSYLDYRQPGFFQGPATADNLRRFLPLGLEIPQVIDWWSGEPPIFPFDRLELVHDTQLGRSLKKVSLFDQKSGLVERLWILDADLSVEQVEVGPVGGPPTHRLTFGSFRQPEDPGSPVRPYHITASDLNTGAEIVIDYKEVRVNPELPEHLFAQTPPAGMAVRPIYELVGGGGS